MRENAGGSKRVQAPWARAAVWVVGSLMITVLIGAGLRWVLAGWALPWGGFARWRHAQSHLGYFAVLFPLMWGWWSWSGAALGPWSARLYGLGTALATLGFIRVGYGPEAIAGSTVVGVIWVFTAIQRLRGGPRLAWSTPAPWAILLVCCCIPFIAFFTLRDPTFAAQIVRSFLGLLLLGAFIPTALGGLKFRAPNPWLWLSAAVAGAAFLGLAPLPLLGLGLIALGAMVTRAIASGDACPWDVRLLWGVLALGMAVMGSGLLPNVLDSHPPLDRPPP